jgi:hypothetical protein
VIKKHDNYLEKHRNLGTVISDLALIRGEVVQFWLKPVDQMAELSFSDGAGNVSIPSVLDGIF